jgi:GNAT superfamily N-acetyltransferase
MTWTLAATIQPDQADIAAVDRGLQIHNRAHLGEGMADHFRRLAVFARDDGGIIVGGVHGWFFWEWLHVDTLWVADTLRGQGLGSALIQAIEALAVEQAATGIHLETTDFQALPFYQKLGYTVFGELPDKPAGHTWYYLQKRLS